jgi:PAS domain S-box-containing protein
MEKARILIVEDETVIALGIESKLQILGYEVTSIVNSGDKAIEKAESEKPDLILMDIRLKGEMDGIDAAEVIRNKFGIPVIFSTAYLDQERIERVKITMPFGYLLKPIQERDLNVTLEMALYVAKVDAKRKKAEKATKESEEKYRVIFENSGSIIAVLDTNARYLYANPAHKKKLGYDPEELIGKSGFELIHEEDMRKMTEHLAKGMAGDVVEVHETYRVHSKDDKVHFLESTFNASFNEKGRLVRIIAVSEDVTEKRNYQEMLEVQEKMYRELFQYAPAGIYHMDLKTYRITEINDLACEYLGYSKQEILEMSDPIMILEKKSREEFLKRMESLKRHQSLPTRETFDLVRKDGTIINTVMYIQFVYENEEIVAARIVAHDITDMR